MSEHSKKNDDNLQKPKKLYFTYLFLFLFILIILMFVFNIYVDTSPPDLSSCDRIEIRYPKGNFGKVGLGTDLQNVLSEDDKEYIRSFEFFIIDDQERIKTFAKEINLGKYSGQQKGTSSYAMPANFTCYINGVKHITFTEYEGSIITEDKRRFIYPNGHPNLYIIEPLELKPFRLRCHCAWVMESLFTTGFYNPQNAISYPEYQKWCDNIVDVLRNKFIKDKDLQQRNVDEQEYIKNEVYIQLTCPSVYKRVYGYNNPFWELEDPNSFSEFYVSNYAMNPNCTPDSPDDMVLLFETEDGWNQHGGPELFTFDNHEPKGGCVLLNDGTVKFIRTEEELKALRWE